MSEGDTIPLRGSADMWRSRAKAAEAEVARLKEQNRHDSEADRACRELLVEELDEALAKVKELRAELSTAKRTATEAALKYSYNELSGVREASDRGAFISRAIKALLGNNETNTNNQGERNA